MEKGKWQLCILLINKIFVDCIKIIHHLTLFTMGQFKEVFKIAEFDGQGNLRLLIKEYSSYEEAKLIILAMPSGTYQIQKVFVVIN